MTKHKYTSFFDKNSSEVMIKMGKVGYPFIKSQLRYFFETNKIWEEKSTSRIVNNIVNKLFPNQEKQIKVYFVIINRNHNIRHIVIFEDGDVLIKDPQLNHIKYSFNFQMSLKFYENIMNNLDMESSINLLKFFSENVNRVGSQQIYHYKYSEDPSNKNDHFSEIYFSLFEKKYGIDMMFNYIPDLYVSGDLRFF